MGLAEVQKTLAQLYTDRDLREKFLASPKAVATDLGLNSKDLEQLTQLSTFHLREFSESLHYKRMGEVRDLLPFTSKSLKAKFAKFFLKFADGYLPSGVKKHRDDAIAFAEFISKKSDSVDWCKEIAIYEATRLKLAESSKIIIFRLFHFPLKAIFSQLLQSKEPVLEKKLTLAIWIRLPGKKTWNHYLLSFPGS
ncbi:MAG: hypothetical protein JNM06_08055 [Blastocatellia bacterium]|nr:hypothetical protein [Blastocatellia bacterium]